MRRKNTLYDALSGLFMKALPLCLVLSLCVSYTGIAMTDSESQAQSETNASLFPQRIVVFPLFAEEMLLEMIGPDRIVYVGHEYYENGEVSSPTMELTKNIAGRYWNMTNDKKILALHPDLIVLDGEFLRDYTVVFSDLYEAGIPFLFLDTPKTIEDIRNVLITLGAEVGAPEKAAGMAEAMEAELAQITEIVSGIPEEKRVRVIHYEYWDSEDGNGSEWFEQDSFIMLARAAGVIAGGPDTREFIYVLADDLVAKQRPDIITFDYTNYYEDGSICDVTGRYHDQIIASILNNPNLSSVPAIINHEIYPIQLCESQFIVRSVKELAQLAYPELFPEEEDQ